MELKLEASKRKLQLGYQQVQKAKRKIQLVDLRDIPKPEPEINLSKNPSAITVIDDLHVDDDDSFLYILAF